MHWEKKKHPFQQFLTQPPLDHIIYDVHKQIMLNHQAIDVKMIYHYEVSQRIEASFRFGPTKEG